MIPADNVSIDELERMLRDLEGLRDHALHAEIEASRIPGDEILLEQNKRLIGFAKNFWHVVEPKSVMFKEGWAIRAIFEHLEAVTYGHMIDDADRAAVAQRIIQNLLMNVVPGILKSMGSKVFWPAWWWGPMEQPWMRFISASYSSQLSERDALKLLQLIRSDVYQRLYPHVKISPDQSAKTNFHTTARGFMMTTSVSGVGTGARSDVFIIDDPNSVQQAESDAIRRSTNLWFTEVVPTRINDPMKSSIVVIQQRTHGNDVSGVILAENQDKEYEHLCMPMEFEEANKCKTRIGWEDPRQKEGELVFPERFPQDWVFKKKKKMGPYAVAAQFQQRPSPRGGGIIALDDWEIWEEDEYPQMEFILDILDTNYNEEEQEDNDYNGYVKLGVFRDRLTSQPNVMLMYSWRDRELKLHGLVEKIEKSTRMSGMQAHKLLIENKSKGSVVTSEIQRLFANTVPVSLVNRTGHRGRSTPLSMRGDKVALAYAVQHLFHERFIHRPKRSWATAVAIELAELPKGLHDDLADPMTIGLNWLRMSGFLLMPKEGTGEHFPTGREIMQEAENEGAPYDA